MADREFTANPYYSPEKCGLVQVDQIEEEPDYDFNMLIVWRDKASRKLFWDQDAGCSCPSPFEDVRRLSDLTTLNKTNFHGFKQAVESMSRVSAEERSRFIAKWRTKIFTPTK